MFFILSYNVMVQYGGAEMVGRAGEKIGTSIFHIVLRGIDRQVIFENNGDYQKLLGTGIIYWINCKTNWR